MNYSNNLYEKLTAVVLLTGFFKVLLEVYDCRQEQSPVVVSITLVLKKPLTKYALLLLIHWNF